MEQTVRVRHSPQRLERIARDFGEQLPSSFQPRVWQ